MRKYFQSPKYLRTIQKALLSFIISLAIKSKNLYIRIMLLLILTIKIMEKKL